MSSTLICTAHEGKRAESAYKATPMTTPTKTEWRMTDDGWRMTDDGWRMTDDRWRMSDDGCQTLHFSATVLSCFKATARTRVRRWLHCEQLQARKKLGPTHACKSPQGPAHSLQLPLFLWEWSGVTIAQTSSSTFLHTAVHWNKRRPRIVAPQKRAAIGA